MQIRGTVAAVTGGGSGIGRAITLSLARRGATVAVADLDPGRAAQVAAEVEALGSRSLAVPCDVRSDTDVDSFAAQVLDTFGRVDTVVNNAGFGMAGPPESIPMADWQAIIDVNLLGVVRGIRAFVPHLLAQGSGWLVNTASIGGMYAYDHSDAQLPYVTTKFAVRGMTEALYLYLRPRGIGVSVLCPGRIRTNIGESSRLVGTDDPAWIRVPRLHGSKDADGVGELVADAIVAERFLVLTDEEDYAMLGRRYADLDAALETQLAQLTPPQGPAYGWVD